MPGPRRHFANVLPDLAADRMTGVEGLPQIVAARWGGRASGGRDRAAAGGVGAAAAGGYPVPPVGSRDRPGDRRDPRPDRISQSGKIPVFCRPRYRCRGRRDVPRRRRGANFEFPVAVPAAEVFPACYFTVRNAHRGGPVRFPAAPLCAGRDHRHGGGSRWPEPGPARLADRLHGNSGVSFRNLVFPIEEYQDVYGIEQSNERYVGAATDLGGAGPARGALDDAGVLASDLDLLIVTSVTGVIVPSIDALLIPRLGLRPDIKRLPVFGLGCVAGAAALARLHDYLLAWPGTPRPWCRWRCARCPGRGPRSRPRTWSSAGCSPTAPRR